jgi:predicted Zn-dependent protease
MAGLLLTSAGLAQQSEPQNQTAPATQAAPAADTTQPTNTTTPLTPKEVKALREAEAKKAAADAKADKEAQKKMPKNSDIDNIGSRDINKHSIDFMSYDKEIAMGRQMAAQVEREVKLVQDPVVNEYINRVGQNLVRNSDAKVPFTIKVVESEEINAFALPGGFFYVNSALILAADDEAELAGVMAHEIAHVTARHGAEQQSKAMLLNVATIPLIFLAGPAGMAVRQTSGLIIPAAFYSFTRSNEAEADYLGLQYMYKTGYDPTAAVSFFEKLEAKETAKPGSMSKLFATHPLTADRIVMEKANIEKILPDKDQYVVTTSEFNKVKAQLASIENNRRPSEEDSNKPSLRRRTASTTRDDGNDRNSTSSRPSTTQTTAGEKTASKQDGDGGDGSTTTSNPDGSSTSSTSTTSPNSDGSNTTATSSDSTTNSDGSTSDSDDDRPVLKRRP